MLYDCVSEFVTLGVCVLSLLVVGTGWCRLCSHSNVQVQDQNKRSVNVAHVNSFRAAFLLVSVHVLPQQVYVTAEEFSSLSNSMSSKNRYTRLVQPCTSLNAMTGYRDLTAPIPFAMPLRKEEYYRYTEYLKDCDIDTVCVTDLVEASQHNNDAFVRHYLQPGTVFQLPVADTNPYTWLVKDILTIFEKYNASRQDFQLFHAADETHHFNHPKLIEFYYTWKKVYRETWHITPEYKKLVAENRLGWVPITPPHLPPNISASGMKPSSLRQHNVSFRGNRATNSKRRGHWKELQRHMKKRDTRLHGQVFKSGAHNIDPTKGHYMDEMMDTRLCLNLKGNSPECYRFYENLECGCIPVIIDAFESFNYKQQFDPWKQHLAGAKWRKGHELPFIWAKSVDEFMSIYDNLFLEEGGMARLDAMQRDTMEWWQAAKAHLTQLTMDGVCPLSRGETLAP